MRLHLHLGGDPVADLAWELALLDAGEPTAFAYAWDEPVLVLGRGQRADGVDLAAAEAAGVRVLHRHSGGTGVLHQGDLALCLVLPASDPRGAKIRPLYEHFLDGVAGGLADLGVHVDRGTEPPAGRGRSPICFEDHALESLLLGGRKVLGAAQKRRRNAVLVHGTVLFTLDPKLQGRLYRVEPARITRAMVPVPLPLDAREGLARAVWRRWSG